LGPEPGSPTIQFGDGLELDARAWELRRAGQPQKLERIPMEILLLLAQQHGKLVSREQIVERVWGKGVYLDTDNSINGAMRKIRQALGDDSGEPRYIQTVTGVGYRFIAQPAAASSAIHGDPVTATSAQLAPQSPDTSKPDATAVPVHALASVTAAASGPFVERRRAPAAPPPVTPPVAPPTRGLGATVWWVSAALIVVLCAALLWMLRARAREEAAAPPAHASMLAVLPLANLTGDPAQEYFSDGLTEELIAQLGDVDPQHLSVIARTSVMRYKNTHEAVDEIARALGAQYVLEGSVRRDSQNVRITAQLVRASDQAHVWSRQYDRKLTSVLALQGEIAEEIADEIRSTLGQRAAGVPARVARAPQPYAAFDLYLRGRYFWNRRTAAGFSQALDYFQQSIAKDPGYAPAQTGVADTYAMMSNYGLAPHTEAMVNARAAAVRAIELDANLAEAHNALAVIAEDYDYDWRTAEKEFQRAIELNPNYATAHQWYAQCLALQGRFSEALAHSERARALDPLSTIVVADHAVILYFARQYERAIDASHTVLAMEPSSGRVPLVPSLVQKGRAPEALAYLSGAGDGPWVWALRAYVYGRTGERSRAGDAIGKMDEVILREHVDPFPIRVIAYAGVQDRQRTLANLETGYTERASFLTTIKVDQMYDFLRDDPGFQDLMRRVGLR
jgi:TolB-like protein/DNA-binding winged helix-turn-helix (wHTH) protein